MKIFSLFFGFLLSTLIFELLNLKILFNVTVVLYKIVESYNIQSLLRFGHLIIKGSSHSFQHVMLACLRLNWFSIYLIEEIDEDEMAKIKDNFVFYSILQSYLNCDTRNGMFVVLILILITFNIQFDVHNIKYYATTNNHNSSKVEKFCFFVSKCRLTSVTNNY